MTEVLSSPHCASAARDVEFFPCQQAAPADGNSEGNPTSSFAVNSPVVMTSPLVGFGRSSNRQHILQQEENRGMVQSCRNDIELSLLTFVFEALRRSGLSCQGSVNQIKLDIGRPTNVRHVAHVTFDRFNGFLGLPAEFQLEIPRRVPSASVSAFGVSAESMQCSYDRKGNSVPTILLLLQERLYDQGGLKAEGIFRINAENSQEEHVRSQLNSGIVPYGIDVHCLAGLIKAWFRELPRGVLDSLSPEQVMQCHSEEQAVALVKTLPPMQAALLDWGINLMADVVQEENFNKMNAHNIAMVFAPNMTQMSDPLTALMHAVQVMNLLKMLILRTLRDREEVLLESRPTSSCSDPPNGNGPDNVATMRTLPNKLGNDKHTFDGRQVFQRSHLVGDSIDDYKSSREPSNGSDQDSKATSRTLPNKAVHAVDEREVFFRSFLVGNSMDDHESSCRPSNRNGQDNIVTSRTRPNKAGHERPTFENRQVILKSHPVGDNIGNYRNGRRPYHTATMRPFSNKTGGDNHHGIDERQAFRSFLVRDSIDDCESAHNLDEMYARRPHSRYEHDLSSERQGSSSNASSSLDDDSRCSSPKLFSRASSWNHDAMNSCVKHSLRSKSEFSNLVENMDHLTVNKSEDIDISEFVQCGELGPVPGTTKRKGNVGRVDKFIGRVEAW